MSSALREHPSLKQLHSFVSGTMGQEGARSIVSHLLLGCRDCRAEVARLDEVSRGLEILPVRPQAPGLPPTFLDCSLGLS